MDRELAIKVEAYGDGCIPENEEDCVYKGNSCCISRSEGSVCGGFMGHSAKEGYIRCQNDLEEKDG